VGNQEVPQVFEKKGAHVGNMVFPMTASLVRAVPIASTSGYPLTEVEAISPYGRLGASLIALEARAL
jgi:hypothetical protein